MFQYPSTESPHPPVPRASAAESVHAGHRGSPRAHSARAPRKVKPTSVTLATCLINPGEPLRPPAQFRGLVPRGEGLVVHILFPPLPVTAPQVFSDGCLYNNQQGPGIILIQTTQAGVALSLPDVAFHFQRCECWRMTV